MASCASTSPAICACRFAARDAGYRRDLSELYQFVKNGDGPQWIAAHGIADEVMRRSLPIRRHSLDALLGLRSTKPNRGRRP
jgi:hypothetical protein